MSGWHSLEEGMEGFRVGGTGFGMGCALLGGSKYSMPNQRRLLLC
jgi:hypothetical protein